MTNRGTIPVVFEALKNWPLPPMRRMRAARQRLDAIMARLIRECRAATEPRGDFLSMLVEAAESDDGTGGMTEQQVRDEAMTIFVAGHETTANALTWTWYLLAQHPDAERALHTELDTVSAGRAPTFADLPRLRYTAMTSHEAMRLYPPVWIITRKTQQEFTLDGYRIPVGSYLHMCQFVGAPRSTLVSRTLALRPVALVARSSRTFRSAAARASASVKGLPRWRRFSSSLRWRNVGSCAWRQPIRSNSHRS